MSIPFSTSFQHPIARDTHQSAVERALLILAEAVAMRQRAYTHPAEFVRVPSDPVIFAESHDLAERLWTSRLSTVVIVGIGGSNLGAKAVFEALDRVEGGRRHIELLSLDTCEPRAIERILRRIDERVTMPEEIAIIIGTKSGTTAETLMNSDILLDHLLRKDIAYERRVAVISDVSAPTKAYAAERGFRFASIPHPIGGRFSVFTQMGLLPLSLLGIDVKEFRKGAEAIFAGLISGKDTSAVRLAREIASMQRSNIHVMDFFFFDPALESLGKWARQLIAESLGKTHDRDGRTVRTGVTPTVSLGSVDLHSMAQLIFGGPKDRWTMLVSIRDPQTSHFPAKGFASLAHLSGHTPNETFRAILAGTRAAYLKNALPFLDVEFPAPTPYAVGAWMAWMMAAVYIAGEILNINPFDQPAVEDYKEATRTYLSHHKKR